SLAFGLDLRDDGADDPGQVDDAGDVIADEPDVVVGRQADRACERQAAGGGDDAVGDGGKEPGAKRVEAVGDAGGLDLPRQVVELLADNAAARQGVAEVGGLIDAILQQRLDVAAGQRDEHRVERAVQGGDEGGD